MFDLAGFLGHALSTGYDGVLSLEVLNDVYRRADPRYAATGVRSLARISPDEDPRDFQRFLSRPMSRK